MIRIIDGKYKYEEKTIFEHLNLEIKSNKITAIIGKNGIGKTTLVNILSGLYILKKGKVVIDELSINRFTNSSKIRNKISIVSQNPDNFIIYNNVYDDIMFTLKNMKKDYDKQYIESCLQEVGMEKFIDANPYELSYGQKQKISIANMLAVNTEYIILDEVTAMLDSNSKNDMYNLIKRLKTKGKTIIFTTNLLEELFIADEIIVLNENKPLIIKKKNLVKNIDKLESLGFSIPLSIKIYKLLSNKDSNINYKDDDIIMYLEKNL